MPREFMKRFILLAAALVFWGCEPEPDNLKLLDELVVSTNYDRNADFGSYSTFSLPVDTIGFISNSSNDTILVHARSELVRPILTEVKTNMLSRGYTLVDKSENPDVAVNVFIVNDINLFQQVVYPNYYYPYYYGYSSSYYYSYPYVETFVNNTGALVVEMVDLINRNPSNQVKVVWTAYMGDIINTVDRLQQSVDAIDQAFVQSPYITK